MVNARSSEEMLNSPSRTRPKKLGAAPLKSSPHNNITQLPESHARCRSRLAAPIEKIIAVSDGHYRKRQKSDKNFLELSPF
jgi:hypothetical protein